MPLIPSVILRKSTRCLRQVLTKQLREGSLAHTIQQTVFVCAGSLSGKTIDSHEHHRYNQLPHVDRL